MSRTPGGRYRLGWRLFELSQAFLEHTDFCIQAKQAMHELVERWGETTHLAVLDGMQVVFVEKLRGTPAVQIMLSRVGARFPAHAAAVGKVLLAAAPAYTLSHLLEGQELSAFTQHTITRRERLEQELEQIRDRGYAVDHEEVVQGVCCVAAPLRDADGHVLAAMSLSLPAYRFFPQEDHYIETIVRVTDHVSEQLGYRRDKTK